MPQTTLTGTPSTSSIEALYTEYRSCILSYFVHRNFSIDDAEDLTQDTFLKALHAFATVQYDDLLPWLYRIAKNVAIDAARKHKVRERNAPQCSLDGYEDRHADGCNQEEMILTRLSLVRALQCVPQHYRRL